MLTTRCPHCFDELHPDRHAFRCTGSCPETLDEPLSTARGTDELGRPVISTTDPGGAVCGDCDVPTTTEVCPRCHYELLPGWRATTTTCLAAAGARSSGKSIYLAVLVKQAERWCERHGQALVPADARTDQAYQRIYEEPLYETRRIIAPTPSAQVRQAPQREPLVFDMGSYGGRHHMLVLRDVAGEDLESTSTPIGPFQFFARADAVVFLFDPLRLDTVRGQLEGVIAPQQQVAGGDPLDVLRNLVRLMRSGAPFGERLKTPLAVVLAKFDSLTELADVEGGPLSAVMANPGAAFNRDESLELGYDHRDAALLQAEVESLMSRLQARPLLNLVDTSFELRQLFAVSALGALPFDADRVSPRGIAPFRVLDPLKWALARNGVIPWS